MKLYFRELLEKMSNYFGLGKNEIFEFLYKRTALAWDLAWEKQICKYGTLEKKGFTVKV